MITYSHTRIAQIAKSQQMSHFFNATINNFAVYAVVRRLKANKFSTSAKQTEFKVQDYPDVSVTIPQPYNGLSLTIKVHQLEDDKGEEGIILSPVVHLKSSQEVKRATVTIPIALCKDQRNVEDMLRSASLEVYGYDKSQKYWDDITSKLRSELKWVKNVCSFKVHLKKDMRLHLRMKLSEQPTGPNLNSPACFDVHPVEFHARLYKLGNDKKLVLCCFPSYVNMESAMSLLNSPYPEVEMEKIFEGEAMSNVSLSNDVDLDVTFSLSHQLKYKQGEEKLEIKRHGPTQIVLDVEFEEDQSQLQNLQVTFLKSERELCKCSLSRCEPPQHQKRMPSTSHGGNASNRGYTTVLPEKESIYYASEQIKLEECKQIEKETRDQSDNPFRHDLRKKRITASKFKGVAARKNDYETLVAQLKKPVRQTQAMRFGRANEGNAAATYAQLKGVNE
ncbi:hypothetical protein AWC38_SpisGene11240 [Stylophora pistillata]|uniref:Uncharacterized protein n=1 Tax=Stylophora pistillata TaxID=50429 RepID=A0A2B4S6R9_STYPI|nr:hypothetical protein AWC38_SpisGene11240 [Stylophora pistillata]